MRESLLNFIQKILSPLEIFFNLGSRKQKIPNSFFFLRLLESEISLFHSLINLLFFCFKEIIDDERMLKEIEREFKLLEKSIDKEEKRFERKMRKAMKKNQKKELVSPP
jgi:hypothetical protein